MSLQHSKYIHRWQRRGPMFLPLFLSTIFMFESICFVHGYQFSISLINNNYGSSSIFPSQYHHCYHRLSPLLSLPSSSIPLPTSIRSPIRLYSSSPKDRQQNQYIKKKGQTPIETFDDDSSITSSSSSSSLRQTNDPRHVAFICDGNSRWAERLDKNTSSTSTSIRQPSPSAFLSKILPQNPITTSVRGHAKGASTLVDLIRHLNIHHPTVRFITVYGFSTENWSRPPHERNGLWEVIAGACGEFTRLAVEERVLVRVLGDMEDERVPVGARDSLRKLEEDTRELRGVGGGEPLTVCLAINYGGRRDILVAARKMAQLLSDGDLPLDNNDKRDEAVMNGLLSTSGIPDPDMIVRTGGEQRLSNFLIWNCAYAELYFTDVLWPDFSGDRLDDALEWYRGRERRFGGRGVTNERLEEGREW